MDIVRFPTEVTLHRLLQSNPIFGSVLVPRRVVDEVGGFCPELSRSQDFDLWLRIVEAGYRVVASREVLAVHRVGGMSWSSDVQAMFHYSQQTYRRALERGNLSPREQRVAGRELRGTRLFERIVSGHGVSSRRTLRALPLLLLVIADALTGGARYRGGSLRPERHHTASRLILRCCRSSQAMTR